MRIGSDILRCSLVLAMLTAGARAVPPLPAERRVPVKVTATLTVPTTQPMHMPTDVAIDRGDNVFVADGANDRIVCFDSAGTFTRAITQTGGEELKRPVGLATDASGQLWIAETGRSRVVVLDGKGSLLQKIPLPAGPEKSFDPTDVAITPDGKRSYIVDNENHRLAIRDNTSGQMKFLGRFGEALGQFRWPFTVAVAPDGYVLVLESIGARAQRLTPDDRWAGQVGRWGVEMGQLYRPKGITVSPRGQILIGDSNMGVIQIFNTRGPLEGVLTDDAGVPFYFKHPMGLAFDSKGRLYVVELGADRIAVIELPARWTTPGTSQPEGRP